MQQASSESLKESLTIKQRLTSAKLHIEER